MGHAAMHGGAGSAIALVILLGLLPCLALCLYFLCESRANRRAALIRWSGWRTTSFATGCTLIVIAVTPAMSDWAGRDLRGHMAQHLLLGMFAPLALMLGAPGTLLLRSVSAGSRRRLVTWLDRVPVRTLMHPITAALLTVGSMYALYLTPLYAFSQTNPPLHVFLHVHFVVSGYLFCWSIAGPDPAPHRPGMSTRLAVLFLSTAAHAVLGKLMFAYAYPRGTGADIQDIRAAAQWMYYGGDVAELLLMVAFFAMWFRKRRGVYVNLAG